MVVSSPTGLTIEELRAKCVESFSYFLAHFGSEQYIDFFHGDLARWLQAHTFTDPKTRVRLRVTLPRGFIKTYTVTVLYCLWRAVRDPEIRILIASNTDMNAGSMVGIIRSFFEKNDRFRAIFKDLLPRNFHFNWSNSRATLPRKGSYMEGTFDSCGVGANITGRHYSLIIEDDTISPQIDDLTGDMYIPRRDEIEKAIGWHRIVEPLMIPTGGGMRIVVGTRWAEDDLLQYVKQNENYDAFERQCIEGIPEDGDWTKGRAIYKNAPMKTLIQLHEDLGDYFFSSLYLNNPLPYANRVFKKDQFVWFDDSEVPEDAYRVLCIDPAVSERDSADYTGFVVCAHSPGAMYVLHASHGRHSRPADVVAKSLQLCETYRVTQIRLEAIAAFQTFIPHFKEELYRRNLGIYFEPVKSLKGSKAERIVGLQPFFERGVIRIRKSQVELQTELLGFNPETLGRQKLKVDIADALSLHVPIYRMQAKEKPPKKPWDGVLTYDWLTEQCGKSLERYKSSGNAKR